MRRSLTALFATLVLAVTGCSAGDETGSPPETAEGGTSSGSTPVGEDPGGAADGFCSWAAPEDLEAVFGAPVEFNGGAECRANVTGGEAPGMYHFGLEQLASFDELHDNLRTNQTASPEQFTLCHEEESTWEGMRTLVAVLCPASGQEFSVAVMLEVGDGRVLRAFPQDHADEQSARVAAEHFLEVYQVYAAQLQGLPLINEWKPGEWVEFHNTGDQSLDLSDFTVQWAGDGLDEEVESMSVPAGTEVSAGGHVVVDVASLGQPTGSSSSTLRLLDADGRPVDALRMSSEPGADEVLRRNGDGGTFCSFASPAVTEGEPNPPAAKRCDE